MSEDTPDILDELDSPTLKGAYRDEIAIRRRAADEIRRLRAELAEAAHKPGMLILEIEAPAEASNEEILAVIGQVVSHADDIHRAAGGHGLELEHAETHHKREPSELPVDQMRDDARKAIRIANQGDNLYGWQGEELGEHVLALAEENERLRGVPSELPVERMVDDAKHVMALGDCGSSGWNGRRLAEFVVALAEENERLRAEIARDHEVCKMASDILARDRDRADGKI